MNRGAWWVTVDGIARVRYDLATTPPPPHHSFLLLVMFLVRDNQPLTWGVLICNLHNANIQKRQPCLEAL